MMAAVLKCCNKAWQPQALTQIAILILSLVVILWAFNRRERYEPDPSPYPGGR